MNLEYIVSTCCCLLAEEQNDERGSVDYYVDGNNGVLLPRDYYLFVCCEADHTCQL